MSSNLDRVCQDCGVPVLESSYGRPCDECGCNWAVSLEDFMAVEMNGLDIELAEG